MTHDLKLLRKEFPDYDVATLPALPAAWVDASWHNDVCPAFFAGLNAFGDPIEVFVDYLRDEDREFPGDPRFSVVDRETDARVLVATDDWAEVLRVVAEAVTVLPHE